MLTFIVIIALVFGLFYFFAEASGVGLENLDHEEAFGFLIFILNKEVYQGYGKVTFYNKGNFSLYEDGSNQIIFFRYNGKDLTITWRYKFLQQEVVHKHRFANFKDHMNTQETVALTILLEMDQVIAKHQAKILSKSEMF